MSDDQVPSSVTPKQRRVVIIVIDDDDAVRDSTHLLLEFLGYEVRVHGSAEDFLRQPRPDAHCLLLDHHMPGMTGLDLLEKLRSDGDMTPTLVITGRIDPGIKARAKQAGAVLLMKPLDEELLLDSIDRIQRP